jgi:hypothetical protein
VDSLLFRKAVAAASTSLLLVLPVSAATQVEWLTILGDPANADANTVQVDPIPVSVAGEQRILRVRVNLAAPRASLDGIAFHSYESTVLFDCAVDTARYVEIIFYSQPVWSGAFRTVTPDAATMPRWMLFRDIEPNPKQRIIHAACGRAGGS